ncbi:hypothetical protein SDC9_133986 [bioreactor metagenome]|uniref:Uncharacterized protein n=1 Tax=bioreactor metagenome TaxID=1076179 RepID=A0A645DDI3_9ZZZZ
MRGQQLKIIDHRIFCRFIDGNIIDEYIIDGFSVSFFFYAESACAVSLRVCVHKQNTLALLRKACTQVYGCGRLADATFLIGYRDDFHDREFPPIFTFLSKGYFDLFFLDFLKISLFESFFFVDCEKNRYRHFSRIRKGIQCFT